MTITADGIATVIEDAADLIRINGLHKDNYWPGPSSEYRAGLPLCTLGALKVAACSGEMPYITAVAAVTRQIGPVAMWNDSPGPVAMWNDSPGRTADEVVERLVGIAKDLRNGAIEP